MVKDYHDHIIKNKNTLLSKIFGLYKFVIEDGMQAQKIPFVVMGSINRPILSLSSLCSVCCTRYIVCFGVDFG